MIGGLGKTGTGVHTNSVAQKIADRVGGISYMIHSPAVMDSREVKEIMEKDSNVKEIMDMSRRISTAIIGLSDLGDDSRDLGVAGDANLIFIDSQGRHVPNRLDERIVRVPLERLRDIKNVIGVAFGRRKLEVILGALRGQIINILFTDNDTAKRIIKADQDGR